MCWCRCFGRHFVDLDHSGLVPSVPLLSAATLEEVSFEWIDALSHLLQLPCPGCPRFHHFVGLRGTPHFLFLSRIQDAAKDET